MIISAYISFNGNCREAVEYYSQVFETEKPRFLTFGDMPQNPDFPFSQEAKELIMHTQLSINGNNVMFSDTFSGTPFNAGNNISLMIMSKDMDKIKSIFDKLKSGGTVDMDLQETSWSKCYGSLTDKFGIPWQVCHDDHE